MNLKVKDLHKYDKAFLFRTMEELEKKAIKEIKRGGTLTKTREIVRERNRVRHYLYQCRFCADAVTKTEIDGSGNEVDRLVRDCGKPQCEYHEYFYNKAMGKESRIDKLLNNFLKSL